MEYGSAGSIVQSVQSVQTVRKSRAFAGRQFDASLLADLPAAVDPCGERGEFHSFAYDGPMFSSGIDVVVGDVVDRDGFVFADLVPAGEATLA